MLENFLTITSPPILLRVLLEGKIVCVLNYRTSVLFPSKRNQKIKKLVSTPSLTLRVGLGSRILSLRFTIASYIRYKFSWAGWSACNVGETNRHVATRIPEHLSCDKHSHIFKHLRGSENCGSFFKILDSASTSFQLKIAMKPCTSFGSSRL